MKINKHGYWENPTREGHVSDMGLARALISFFKIEGSDSVIDLGCGDGFYTMFLASSGIRCLGVDGNPNTPKLTNGLGKVADLTEIQMLGSHDWSLSLEVGEHIPQEYEEYFLHNLHTHNRKGIILSWAVRGQGGDGHVNCKNNDEVISQIESMGYRYDDDATKFLRSRCADYPKDGWWFRQTLMVFRRTNDYRQG